MQKLKKILALLFFAILNASFLSFAFFNNPDLALILRITLSVPVFCLYLLNRTNIITVITFVCATVILVLQGSVLFANAIFILFSILALKKFDSAQLYRWAIKIQLLFLLFVVFLLITGMHPIGYSNISGRIRYDLGFYNVNVAAIYAYSFLMINILRMQKCTLTTAFCTLLTGTGLFMYCDSRAPFYTLIFFVFSCMMLDRSPQTAKLIFLCTSAVAFISPCLITLSFFQSEQMNKLLSLRPMFFARYAADNTIWDLLLGGSKVVPVDNFYLVFLYNFGVLPYVLLSIFSIKLVSTLYKQNRFLECAFFVSMCVFGLFEGSLLRPEIPIVLFFWLLFANNKSAVQCAEQAEPIPHSAAMRIKAI